MLETTYEVSYVRTKNKINDKNHHFISKNIHYFYLLLTYHRRQIPHLMYSHTGEMLAHSNPSLCNPVCEMKKKRKRKENALVKSSIFNVKFYVISFVFEWKCRRNGITLTLTFVFRR